jgi:hypothetical protein
MQANDREKLMGNYVNSIIFVSLAFIYFLAFILAQTVYNFLQGIFSDITKLAILFWSLCCLVLFHLIVFYLIKKDRYVLSLLCIYISGFCELCAGLVFENLGIVGKPLVIEGLFDLSLLPILTSSRTKSEGGIWHFNTAKGILLTDISEKKRKYEIYRINFIFHYFVMTIYAIILLIAISLNFVFESSSENLPSHSNFNISPDIFIKFLLTVSPLLSQLPQIFFKKNSEKNLNENFTQIPEIDVSLKCSFDKCTLWVKNRSERNLYEIHIPLDVLPDELRKVISKENENPKIPILEPGEEAILAEINRELLVTYLKKNELDFDYVKILYRDTYYRWYSLYIELHKDHVIPIVPTYEKLSLLDAFKMFIIPL